MNFRLKRRRFSQLAIVSAATTFLANLGSKVFAQQSERLYGVSLALASKNITVDLVDAKVANTTPAATIQSIDLANLLTAPLSLVTNILTSTVENMNASTVTVKKALLIKKPSERIVGSTVLPDGTIMIAATAETTQGSFSRFLFSKPSAVTTIAPDKALKILKPKGRNYSSIESVVVTTVTKANQILAVSSFFEGAPPFELVVIDPNTGTVDSSSQLGLPQLPANQRLGNLAQSPDGIIYATNSDGGGVFLVRLDLVNKSRITGRGKIIRLAALRFNNQLLENDLASLACSSSGQLYALADPNYEGTNSLFIVDVKTGAMKLLKKFAVDKIAFALA